MSSLRITSQTRAVGERAAASGGESGIGDALTGGARFAATLGAAAFRTPVAGFAPAGSGGSSEGDNAARKPAAAAATAADGAAALLVLPAVLPEVMPAGKTAVAGGQDAPAGLDPEAGNAAGDGVVGVGAAAIATPAPLNGLMPAGPGGISAIGATPAARLASAAPGNPVTVGALMPPAADPPADSSAAGTDAGPSVSSLAALRSEIPGNSAPSLVNVAAAVGASSLPLAAAVGAARGIEPIAGDRGHSDRSVGPAEPSNTDAAGAVHAGDGVAAAADAPANAATTGSAVAASDVIAGQVSGALIRLASSASREMVVRLHPPELGDLTVRIAVTGRDVSAWFGSSQPQVQLAISDGIGQLQIDLGSAGYNLNGAWVGADASNARPQDMVPPVPPQARQADAAPGFTSSTAPLSRPSATGVNIYV